MKRIKNILPVLFIAISTHTNAQKTFSNLDELLDFAKQKNISIQQGEIKMTQAKKAKLVAIANVIDPAINTTSSFTDNTKLPVNLFPAETFGGQPGTFREIRSGVQYVTNLNQNADIKLLNFGGWENLKLAKINIESTESDNKITLKNLYNNIASSYYNILSLKEQIKSTQENISTSETLWKIAQNKFEQGWVKQQDVNDAKASFLNTQENSRQLEFLTQQNELSLKILCDIPENDSIVINQTISNDSSYQVPSIQFNDLLVSSSYLKEKYALSNYKQYKKNQLPTLSFVASNTFQQNNTKFRVIDNDVNWINSNYLGLKLIYNLPSARSVSQIYNAKFEYQLAQKNTEHYKIKAELDYKQLETDYEKALSQAKTNYEIYLLRKDTYEKNQKLYQEGLMGIDQTINSYNAMVNASYSKISSQINVALAQSKIDINNKIK